MATSSYKEKMGNEATLSVSNLFSISVRVQAVNIFQIAAKKREKQRILNKSLRVNVTEKT